MRWQEYVAREPHSELGQALAAAEAAGAKYWVEPDGRVGLGGTGLHVSVELGVVDNDALLWFKGHSFVLAWEMHQLSGFPLVAVVPADPMELRRLGILRVSVLLLDGSWLDIQGQHDSNTVMRELAWIPDGGITHLRLNLDDATDRNFLVEFLNHLPGAAIETKLSNTYSKLEREVVRDFAHLLLEQAGIFVDREIAWNAKLQAKQEAASPAEIERGLTRIKEDPYSSLLWMDRDLVGVKVDEEAGKNVPPAGERDRALAMLKFDFKVAAKYLKQHRVGPFWVVEIEDGARLKTMHPYIGTPIGGMFLLQGHFYPGEYALSPVDSNWVHRPISKFDGVVSVSDPLVMCDELFMFTPPGADRAPGVAVGDFAVNRPRDGSPYFCDPHTWLIEGVSALLRAHRA